MEKSTLIAVYLRQNKNVGTRLNYFFQASCILCFDWISGKSLEHVDGSLWTVHLMYRFLTSCLLQLGFEKELYYGKFQLCSWSGSPGRTLFPDWGRFRDPAGGLSKVRLQSCPTLVHGGVLVRFFGSKNRDLKTNFNRGRCRKPGCVWHESREGASGLKQGRASLTAQLEDLLDSGWHHGFPRRSLAPTMCNTAKALVCWANKSKGSDKSLLLSCIRMETRSTTAWWFQVQGCW